MKKILVDPFIFCLIFTLSFVSFQVYFQKLSMIKTDRDKFMKICGENVV